MISKSKINKIYYDIIKIKQEIFYYTMNKSNAHGYYYGKITILKLRIIYLEVLKKVLIYFGGK